MCNKHFELNIEIVLQPILCYSRASRAEPYTVCSLGSLRRRWFLVQAAKLRHIPVPSVPSAGQAAADGCRVPAFGNHSLEGPGK